MSHTKIKRTLSVFSALLILLAYIPVLIPVAAQGHGATDKGGCVPSSFFKSGDVIVAHNQWEADENCSVNAVTSGGEKQLRLSSAEKKISVSAVPDNVINCTGYSEVGIYITSVSRIKCSVTLTVVFNGGTSSVNKEIYENEETYLFLPIKQGCSAITSITVEAEFTDKGKDGAQKNKIHLKTAVLSNEDHTKNILDYSVFSVEGIKEDSLVSDDDPVIGRHIITESDMENFTFVAELSGSVGGVTLHYSEDGKEFSAFGSAVLSPDREFYLFSVGKVTENSAYKLEFTGTDDTEVILKNISFIGMKERLTDLNLGSVSKCHLDEENHLLTVSGIITRDTVIEKIDGEILLFEIPMWELDSYHLYSIDPIARVDMSTSFSFSVELKQEQSIFSAFVVATSSNGLLHPLSDPIFPTKATMPDDPNVTVTVGGISCENAFLADVDNFVIDIDKDTFFLKKNSGGNTVFSFGGKSYYTVNDTVAHIDRETTFLEAAGVGVIFNITSSKNSLHLSDVDSCRTAAAVVSYLSERYSPNGFIISPDASPEESLSHTAYSTANVTRLISAAAGADKTVYILLEGKDNPEVHGWLISNYLAQLPKMNGSILLSCDTSVSEDRISAIETSVISGGYISRLSVFTECAAEALTEGIHGGTRSRVIRPTDGKLTIPDTPDGDLFEATVQNEGYDIASGTILWDFTDSYDHSGFTPSHKSSGISTLPDSALEDFTGIRSCRAIKTMLTGDSRVLIATPEHPLDLTRSSSMSFLMSVKADSAAIFDIVFFSGNSKVVFKAYPNSDGVSVVTCDLSGIDISKQIDKIAIIIGENCEAELGIARVSVSGEAPVYITEEIQITDETEEVSAEDSITARQSYIYIGIIAAVSIVAFAVLSLKKA